MNPPSNHLAHGETATSEIKSGIDQGQTAPPFKIAVLTDEPNWGQLETKALRDLGYTVTSYPSTGSLPSFLGLPDLFVLNIAAPQTNQLQLVKDIRAASAQVGIVLVLGSRSPSDAAQAFAAGIDDLIVRPYEAQELLAIVGRLRLRPRSAVEGAQSAAPRAVG